ncbi:MAG: CcmD family protein [Chloroflexi bacterium]|nr:CcmD family protein [Chloroflexota bacterium]
MVYLTAAMIAIWLLTFGYVFYLIQRTKSLEQEIRALETLVKEAEKGR